MANTTNEAFQQFLLWESATRDTLDVKKIYMDIAGDPMAGIALSELLYWYLPDKSGGVSKLRIEKPKEKGGPVYQWIAIRRYEWWDRCRFSPEQADYALRKLIERGLIEKKVFKFDGEPTVHIRLIEDAFLQAFSRLSANPPVNPYLPQKPELGKFPKRIGTPPPENPPNWENSQNELGNFPKTINIDYITPPPPHSADAEKAEIPQSLVEAASHPDIALFRAISGKLPDNRNDWREIIDRMTLIRRERPELDDAALRAEGARYWQVWEQRGYSSPGWLSWWANRRIPEGRGKKRTTRRTNSAVPADSAAPAPATPTQTRTIAVAPPPQYVFDTIAVRRKLSGDKR